jgi:lysophospholipase L1-like esterase
MATVKFIKRTSGVEVERNGITIHNFNVTPIDFLPRPNDLKFTLVFEDKSRYVFSTSDVIVLNSGTGDVIVTGASAAPALGAAAICDKLRDEMFKQVEPQKSNVQLWFIGDSITRGIGTTGTGASSTTPAVIGTNTFPLQAIARLNQNNFTTLISHHSGKTARQYITSYMADDITQFDISKEIICVVEFGANDQATGANTAVSILQDIIELHSALRNAGAKTIVVPVLPRWDAIANPVSVNDKRKDLNKLLKALYKSFADEYVTLENQPKIFNTIAPENSTYFATNDVDGLSKVHPTDSGAALIAEETAQAVARLRGIKLPYSPNMNALLKPISDELYTYDFTTRNGIQLTTSSWMPTVTTGTNWGNTGLSRYKIPAGMDGYIQCYFPDATVQYGMLGFKNTYAIGGYPTFSCGIWGLPNGGSSVSVVENNVITPGVVTLNTTNYLRLIRIGSSVKAQKSTDGQTWTTFFTFAGVYNGDLFIATDIRNDGKLNDPKGFNLVLV